MRKKKRTGIRIIRGKKYDCRKSPTLKYWISQTVVGGKTQNKLIFRYCHAWRCEGCGAWNKKEFIKKVVRLIKTVPLITYIVLTLNHDEEQPKGLLSKVGINSRKFIQNKWRSLQRKLTRQFGKGQLEYVWTLEFQKSSHAHLNILLNKQIDPDWLREAWDKLGGGRVSFCKPIENPEKLTSYISKDLTSPYMPENIKRFSSSQRVPLSLRPKVPPQLKTGTWKPVSIPKVTVESGTHLNGEKIVERKTDKEGLVKVFTTEKV
jgi:hypothetical protein